MRKTNRILVPLGAWSGFFIVAMAAGLFPLLLPPELSWQSSAQEVASYFGGDAQIYIDYAHHFLSTGSLRYAYTAVFPPLTSLWIALILKIQGPSHYFVSSLAVGAFLWAISFCFVFRALTWIESPIYRFVFINLLWLFHTFSDWSLKTGSFFSESKAMPFFIIALSSLVIALRENKIRFWVLSALALAIAAYTRVYFESLGQFIFFFALAGATLNLIQERRVKRGWKECTAFLPWRNALLALAIFSLACLPWKLLNQVSGYGFHMGPGHVRMTFRNLWLPSEKLPEFIVAGNSACIADPELCKIFDTFSKEHPEAGVPPRLERVAAIATALSRAQRWYSHRLSHFWKFWVDKPGAASGISDWRAYGEGGLLLLMGLVALFLSFADLRRLHNARIWACVVLAFSFHTFLVFTFAGLDYRHSLPVRLFFFWAIPFRLCLVSGWGWRTFVERYHAVRRGGFTSSVNNAI